MTSIEPKYKEISEMPRRLFAVGDIHGSLAELEVLLKHLVEQEGLASEDILIFIGDYVDRGPDSKGVIERLLAFQVDFPETIFLKGNHEAMLLGYLGIEDSHGDVYLSNGGLSAVQSYGVQGTEGPEGLRSAIPSNHLSFLMNLERYIIMDRFVFAHAGLNPLRDLKAQIDDDLYWIRDEFIGNLHYFKKTVVFGHTPYHDVLFHLPYKIGIDTGCVFGNMLTCIELVEGRVIQIEAQSDKIVHSSFPPYEPLLKERSELDEEAQARRERRVLDGEEQKSSEAPESEDSLEEQENTNGRPKAEQEASEKVESLD